MAKKVGNMLGLLGIVGYDMEAMLGVKLPDNEKERLIEGMKNGRSGRVPSSI